MPLEALIFDVDGTLANTERDGHLVAFNLAFSEFGLDWVWSSELYNELLDVTGGRFRIKHYVHTYKPNFTTDNLDDFAASLHQLKTKIYLDLVSRSDIPLRTGVVRLLTEARAAGLRIAIATTTTKENVNRLIRTTLGEDGLTWFEVIGAGNMVQNLKPAGDIYTHVLDKMQLKAEQCLAFEDSDNGIIAATEAGLKTVVTVNKYTETHAFKGALVVFDHLGDVNKPFKIIKGEATKNTYVTVDYLRRLHAKDC